ncbi:polysaccharide biosynthesis protein [bacterium]|nr:polysaccharide biosynthesis protein [bacterium]
MEFRKGAGALILAWACILLIGYVYIFWLTRYWPAGEYGRYALVVSILFWIEIAVVNGLPYALVKFVSAEPENAGGLLVRTAWMQGGVSLILFVLTVLFAPWIGRMLNDRLLIFHLRFASVAILFYGFFHLMVSYQNGVKRFYTQAFLLVFYALCKLCLGIALVSLMHTVTAALLANTTAALVALAAGLFLLKPGRRSGPVKGFAMVRFAFPAAVYFLMLNLFFHLDLWLVNYYLGFESAAFYAVAKSLAKIPFFLFLGLSTTLMPILVSRLVSGEVQKAGDLIARAVRFLWMLTAPVAVSFSLSSQEMIHFLFKAEYGRAASVLGVLVWSTVFLSFLFLFTTVLNADHRPGLSLVVTSFAVFLAAGLGILLIPRLGATGGAAAMFASIGIGAAGSQILVFRRFHVRVPVLSLLKTGLAALMLWPVFHFWRPRNFSLILLFAAAFMLYGFLLVVLKEISMREIRGLLGKKPACT